MLFPFYSTITRQLQTLSHHAWINAVAFYTSPGHLFLFSNSVTKQIIVNPSLPYSKACKDSWSPNIGPKLCCLSVYPHLNSRIICTTSLHSSLLPSLVSSRSSRLYFFSIFHCGPSPSYSPPQILTTFHFLLHEIPFACFYLLQSLSFELPNNFLSLDGMIILAVLAKWKKLWVGVRQIWFQTGFNRVSTLDLEYVSLSLWVFIAFFFF